MVNGTTTGHSPQQTLGWPLPVQPAHQGHQAILLDGFAAAVMRLTDKVVALEEECQRLREQVRQHEAL